VRCKEALQLSPHATDSTLDNEKPTLGFRSGVRAVGFSPACRLETPGELLACILQGAKWMVSSAFRTVCDLRRVTLSERVRVYLHGHSQQIEFGMQ